MTAALNNESEMCCLLLQHGCDVNLTDCCGKTALMCAVCYYDSRLSVLVTLLQTGSDLDLDVRDKEGCTV